MKVEYSDLYKFLVSLGVALLSLAVLVPWLFLREPFDLLVEDSTLVKLTPRAQSLISLRQERVEQLVSWLPRFSGICLVFGVIAIVAGLILWYRKIQRHVDQQISLNVKKTTAEIENLTPKEILRKAEIEVDDQDTGAPHLPDRPIARDPISVTRLIQNEKAVARRCEECLSGRYTVLSNKRVGKDEFDLILQSEVPTRPDYVVNIKTARNLMSVSVVQSNALITNLLANSYELGTKRPAEAILLLVASGNNPIGRQRDLVAEAIMISHSHELQVSIVVMLEDEVAKLDCPIFVQLLFGSSSKMT